MKKNNDLKLLSLKKFARKEGVKIPFKIIKCGSTNVFVRENPVNRDTVFLAEEQPQGIGRDGKSFVSRRGGIYMSIVLKREGGAPYPVIAGLAVVNALNNYGLSASLKWPNDVIVNGRKLSGILCADNKRYQNIIVGIGINAENSIEEVKDIAVSLKELGVFVRREELIVKIVREFFNILDLPAEVYIAKYREICLSIGKEVFLSESKERGIAIDVDNEGYLLVDVNGSVKRLINPTST